MKFIVPVLAAVTMVTNGPDGCVYDRAGSTAVYLEPGDKGYDAALEAQQDYAQEVGIEAPTYGETVPAMASSTYVAVQGPEATVPPAAPAAPKAEVAIYEDKAYAITKPASDYSLEPWTVSYKGKTIDCKGDSAAGCAAAITEYEEIQTTGLVDSGAITLNTKTGAATGGGGDGGGR